MSKKVIVAGAGFSGMSLASHLAKENFDVEIYEKNESPGGKVRLYINDGFTFDMGASVYIFPEIFERYFNQFNHTTSDFFSLKRLDPSYRVFFNPEDYYDISADEDKLLDLCNKFELNGGNKMLRYLQVAENYHKRFYFDIFNNTALDYKKNFRHTWINSIFSNRKHKAYIRGLFKSYRIISLLECPLPFLGINPSFFPYLAFSANYSTLKKGVFYPEGGMHQIEEALSAILEELGVPVHLSSEIKNFDIIGDSISGILTNQKDFHAEIFASAMDYYHTEKLIGKDYRNFNNAIWKSKPKYPSVMIFYLGFKKKLPRLRHHNLVFNDCFELPSSNTIKYKSNFKNCLIFITCTSKTDLGKAPHGMENLVARISIPPGLEDTGKMREHYFTLLLNRLENITGHSLKDQVVLKKSYAMNDFEHDYHSYKGQVFGVFNTIGPSLLWSPKIKNKRLSNLYYAELPGVLGSGMASALLTAEMIANYIVKDYNRKN